MACRAACTGRTSLHMLLRRTGQAPSEAVGCHLRQLAARPGKVCKGGANVLLPVVPCDTTQHSTARQATAHPTMHSSAHAAQRTRLGLPAPKPLGLGGEEPKVHVEAAALCAKVRQQCREGWLSAQSLKLQAGEAPRVHSKRPPSSRQVWQHHSTGLECIKTQRLVIAA